MADGACWYIGLDEAGYGPTMGPLVIAATLWQAPAAAPPDTWYSRLAPAVLEPSACSGRKHAAVSSDGAPPPCVIGDSKQVYQSGKGWARLEHSALVLTRFCGVEADTWRELVRRLDGRAFGDFADLPWLARFDTSLPLPPAEETARDAVAASATAFRRVADASGLRLRDVRCRLLCEPRFNRLVAEHESKGRLLSLETLTLARELIESCDDDSPGRVYCDKHGGRDRYLDVLYETLSPEWIEVIGEGREESRYRLGRPFEGWEIRFTARGDRLFPVAAASILAKYLREAAMRAVNQFWAARIPGLAPTAGYPEDARRMLQAIEAMRASLGIPLDWVRRRK
ncbi:ribonuclease H family protein [Thermopirellula anaerolimosa]